MVVHRGHSKRRQGQTQRSGGGRYYNNNTDNYTRLTAANCTGPRPEAVSYSSPHFPERTLRLRDVQVTQILQAEPARARDGCPLTPRLLPRQGKAGGRVRRWGWEMS